MADIQDNARMAVLRDQEERVVAYNDFEEGYRKYLNGGDETDYTRLCTEVTARFQAASHDVNNCEEQLKGVGAVQLCG